MRLARSGSRVDLIAALAVFGFALVSFLRAAESAPFHGDESEWINAGRYFKYLFLDGDVSGPVWRPSFITRDQPPLGRYVIGGIVWAAGNDLTTVNRSYRWAADLATNEREGRVPGPHLLEPVRRGMAGIGALSVVGLYFAARLIGGPLAGLLAALVATSSPLVQLYFVQARTEALLAAFTILALLGTLVVARAFQQDGWFASSGWLTGLALGLALATKLTALLAILGTAGFGVAAALNRWPRDRGDAVRIGSWSIGVGVLAFAVFVAVNPFLWPDPPRRTYSMLDQQRSIMVEQGQEFGGAVQLEPLARVWLVVQRTFVENATPAFDENLPPGSPPVVRRTFFDLPAPFGVSVELAAAVAGLLIVLCRAVPSWKKGARHGVETALLWWLVAYFVGIGGNLSLDWPRYYVPTAFLGSILIGVASAYVAVRVGSLLVIRSPLARTRARWLAATQGQSVGAAHEPRPL